MNIFPAYGSFVLDFVKIRNFVIYFGRTPLSTNDTGCRFAKNRFQVSGVRCQEFNKNLSCILHPPDSGVGRDAEKTAVVQALEESESGGVVPEGPDPAGGVAEEKLPAIGIRIKKNPFL